MRRSIIICIVTPWFHYSKCAEARAMPQNTQKEIFLAGEGDAWFDRNVSHLTDNNHTDPIMQCLAEMLPFPHRVLEVGCSNGWRLDRINAAGAGLCYGIDPSRRAIECGKRLYTKIELRVGTADKLPDVGLFDVVIYGFCLYLCDPADHFRIVTEGDRVLRDGGTVLIHDFDPPCPYRNSYEHCSGAFSYKMDYAKLFLAHPHYTQHRKLCFSHSGDRDMSPDNRVAVSWLVKGLGTAWPLNPWRQAAGEFSTIPS
jgi:SAM-dependent methyltransferase